MGGGFVAGLITGVVLCLIVVYDKIGGVFTVIGALAGAVAALLTFADSIGVVGLLVVIGLGMFAGRNWAENRRGRKEAEAAWNKRKDFR